MTDGVETDEVRTPESPDVPAQTPEPSAPTADWPEPSASPDETNAMIPAPGAALEPSTTDIETTAATTAGAEVPADQDPFPRDAWSTLTSHAAGYLRLTLALLRDPAVSKHRRAALLAAAAYFASPIDLVPGIVPILGQVDDLAVAMLAIRLALNALEPARRQMHLAAAGLSDEALHEDLVAAGRLGAWAARAGARAGIRVGRGFIRLTVRSGRAAADLVVRGGRAAARRATPVVDQTSTIAGQAATTASRRVSDAGKAGTALAGRIRRRRSLEPAPDVEPSEGSA